MITFTRHHPPGLGDHSPWGVIDACSSRGPDCVSVSTPSHGGLWLSPAALDRIPAAVRPDTQWLEEDCSWAIAYVFLGLDAFESSPERGAANKAQALLTLQHWIPDAYELHTGTTLLAGQSHARDRAAFNDAHATSIQALSAFGDWAAWVPEGLVGLIACVGGRNSRGGFAGPERYFLVQKAEYTARGSHPFVLDPTRHSEIARPDNLHARKEAA